MEMESATERSCVKSTKNTAFSTKMQIGDANKPKNISWIPKISGEKYYFCGVGTHCTDSKMYGMIKVLGPGMEHGEPHDNGSNNDNQNYKDKDDNKTVIIIISVTAGVVGIVFLIVGAIFIYKKCEDRKDDDII